MSRKSARRTFSTFHSRKNVEPVYPFNKSKDAEIETQAKFPEFVCVGRAVRVLYDSDKWNKVGDVVGYYHDHGPDDGAHVFKDDNKVKLYAPKAYFPDLKVCPVPVDWPSEMTLLGACSGWVAQPGGKGSKVIEAEVENCVLVCSPFGHVDKKNDVRVFLAVINTEDGIVECIIAGPGLTVTDAGIEG
jgi:hypothetical protein